MKLEVKLQDYQYSIYIQQGLFNHITDYISPVIKSDKLVIISDDHVYPLYGETIKNQLSQYYTVYHIVVKHGEQSKSFETLPDIYKQLLSFQISRKDTIIALGGGVIGDLAGFIASTYLRGIDFIQIPTSLLAQVDSSVGGKVGIDLEEGKNLVGAFKHPLMVLIDPLTLKTLDKHYISDGMGEVIKYACLFDKELFNQLSTYKDFYDLYTDIDEIIYKCISYKKQVVEQDVYDNNIRMLLNFGHTLGHAIETYYHYNKYSHGEAVSIGMVQITRLTELMNLSVQGLSDQIAQLCLKYNLPIKADLNISNLIKTIQLDKKNNNNILSFIIINDISQASIFKENISVLEQIKEI